MNFLRNLRKLFFLVAVFITCLIATGTSAGAYEFPIAELGNCRDQKECHLFCEIPINKASCWSFTTFGRHEEVLGEETPEAKLAAFGITFPINELGNCATIKQCKGFCNLAGSQNLCQEFARQHGLAHQESIINVAQTELGCDSPDSCRSFCDESQNQDQCALFSQRYNLVKAEPKIISQAQLELGCQTSLECFTFCERQENKSKCENFSFEEFVTTNPTNKNLLHNLPNLYKNELIKEVSTKLGCTTDTDCRNVCDQPQNRELCQNIGNKVRKQVRQLLVSNGSCDTAEECRKICLVNPDRCPHFPKNLIFQVHPVEILKQLINRPSPTSTVIASPFEQQPSPVPPLATPRLASPLIRPRPSPSLRLLPSPSPKPRLGL